MLDRESYLQRVGYAGNAVSGLVDLAALVQAHQMSVPWENLAVFLDEPQALSIDVLFERIVAQRRGGTCWELNFLFAALLDELGFQASFLCAQSWDPRNSDWTPPFDHMVLSISISGHDYLVDVGLGKALLPPLPLHRECAVSEGCRMRIEGRWRIIDQMHPRTTEWKVAYRFELTAFSPDDFVPQYRLRHTTSGSHFTDNWFVAMAGRSGVSRLIDTYLVDAGRASGAEKLTPANLHDRLSRVFGLDLKGRVPRLSEGVRAAWSAVDGGL